ncbi:MAG: nucleotidyltransferase domain-containing protein [Epsilonproteobacteria bacterium]|nr:nucleotidyltransferase domain-containing protein [Campylobacterota bacterium]
MRLTTKEIEAIISTFKDTFENGDIYLFGSRIDDSKKGGDIDLYIQTNDKDNLNEKKINFLIKLKQKIGEQKIDVVISKDKNKKIEQIALKEGILLDEKKSRIQKYINECEKHKLRIEKAYSKIKDILPLSARNYENLSDDEVAAIDQYLFRFAKLQDTIGDKLFRLIVSEYVENIDQMTFLDILNHLEKIGILDSADVWKRLRAIRNEISHQYDDDPTETAQSLNNIFAYKDELINIFDEIKKVSKTL